MFRCCREVCTDRLVLFLDPTYRESLPADERSRHGQMTKRKAHVGARERGWSHSKDGWLCPECKGDNDETNDQAGDIQDSMGRS